MAFCCDREGSPQAFRMDLKTGETRQLTEVEGLDSASLTLTADNGTLCYFAGRSLYVTDLAALRERAALRGPGRLGAHARHERGAGRHPRPFVERQGRALASAHGARWRARRRTIVERRDLGPVARSLSRQSPSQRPMRAQTHSSPARTADATALWLVNSDGKQNRQLKLAAGRPGAGELGARWQDRPLPESSGGSQATERHPRVRARRDTDKLVAKTSQYVAFGFNRDTSVFVGASRNAASPDGADHAAHHAAAS